MYCPHCGNPVASDLKFCTNCGTRMPDLSLLANAEPAPAPASAPAPVSAPAQTPVTPSPVVTAAPATNRRGTTMRIVAVVIVVVLVLVAGTATFLGTRGMLPWQSVPVPSLDQLAGKQGATVDSLTADQVEAELRSEGFQTTRSQQYSGKSAGAFLSFSNVSEGQQLRHGDLVGIIESLGPGVPSGTIGTQAADSKQTLAGMNVPVTYRAVVTSVPGSSFSPADASAAAPGTVVATYPADGQPVADTGSGITVAVATQSDTGIPVDYYGQDPDAVQADLESRGYTVTRKAKFSTKANVGKVVASDPALGTAAAAGTSVTLYYGVDSSSTHDVLTDIYQPTTGANDGPEAAQGTYCRKDGNCITLSKDCSNSYCDLYSSQTGSADISEILVPCFFTQGTCMTTSLSLGMDRAPHWEDSPLLFGDTGTFELTTWRQVASGYCGTDGDWKYLKWETMSGSSEQVCVDGQIRQDPGVNSSLDDPGYQMDDAWYVYVPVGADIKAVEDMGYFDADAMSQAASQGEPDSGTPYLIARDPSLYTDQQRRQYKHDVFPDLASVDTRSNVNPSIAFLGNRARYAVKPAPSDQSAYYLVENPVDPNNLASFPQIPDNQIENPSVPDSKSSDQQQADQAAAEEAARQQQEAAERQAALNAVAGDYRQFIVPHTLTAGDAMVGCYPMHTVKLNSDGTYTERSATCADYTTYSGSITSISTVDDHTYNLTLTPTATGESTMGTNPLPSLGNVQVWLAGRTVTEYPICTQEQMTNLDSYPSLECHTISEIVDDSGHLEKNAAIASDSIPYQE